jgi:RNA polymerase sigma-70 factor (ECF subfamily)
MTTMADAAPSPTPDDDTTELLLRRARGGDSTAFDALFRRHGERLRRTARGQVPTALRGRIDDSDVVQEALVDAVANLDSFEERGEGSFRRWLATLLRHRLLTTIQRALGRQKRDPRRETRLRDLSSSRAPQLASSRTSPSAAAVRAESKEALEQALARLPADHAAVLRLVRLEEKSLAEAAAAMGRTENAAKKLLARALLSLRAELAERESGLGSGG